MDRRIIQYVFIAVAVVLLICAAYLAMTGHYVEKEEQISDSIILQHPISSKYTVSGDKIEFRDPNSEIYNLDIQKVSSKDKKVTYLLNYLEHMGNGDVGYYNESCYLVNVEVEDDDGFSQHCMIIPIDSFNKDDLSFKNDTDLWLFDGNNREFVFDSVLNSQVVL